MTRFRDESNASQLYNTLNILEKTQNRSQRYPHCASERCHWIQNKLQPSCLVRDMYGKTAACHFDPFPAFACHNNTFATSHRTLVARAQS